MGSPTKRGIISFAHKCWPANAARATRDLRFVKANRKTEWLKPAFRLGQVISDYIDWEEPPYWNNEAASVPLLISAADCARYFVIGLSTQQEGLNPVLRIFLQQVTPLRTLPFEVNCPPTTSSSIGQPAAFITSISCEPPPMPSCSVQRVLSERCL